MIKPQLYEVVKLHKPCCICHIIDEIAQRIGHYILRLPPYHAKLNAIELVWVQTKRDVARHNSSFKMKDVTTQLKEGLVKITLECWQAVEQHVIKFENELYESEERIDSKVPEDDLNSFRFHIDADSDEDSSSSSDSSDPESESFSNNKWKLVIKWASLKLQKLWAQFMQFVRTCKHVTDSKNVIIHSWPP